MVDGFSEGNVAEDESTDAKHLGWKVDADQVKRDMPVIQKDRLWPKVHFTDGEGRDMFTTVRPRLTDIRDNIGLLLCQQDSHSSHFGLCYHCTSCTRNDPGGCMYGCRFYLC